jgi:hypothetical protein
VFDFTVFGFEACGCCFAGAVLEAGFVGFGDLGLGIARFWGLEDEACLLERYNVHCNGDAGDILRSALGVHCMCCKHAMDEAV